MTTATLEAASPPKPERYVAALENVYKVRPRVPVDTWTEQDAAKHWWPEYDPTASNMLPASLVTGVAARLFAINSRWLAPFRRFWTVAGDAAPILYPSALGNLPNQLNWGGLCGHIHVAFHPNGSEGKVCNDSQMGILENDHYGYCHRKSCKHTESVVDGCVNQTVYEDLENSGAVVPWSAVRKSGVETLFTPLRWQHADPYISVRRERSHYKSYAVPYYVAQRLELWNRMIPSLLSMNNIAAQLRGSIVPWLNILRDERLRFYSIATMSGHVSEAMSRWDDAFTTSCWMFGRRDEDVYGSFHSHFWMVDYPTHKSLIDTEPDQLFPPLPQKR